MGPARRSQFAAPCKGTPHIHLWATHWPVICIACAAAPRLWAHGLGCPHNCYMHLAKMVWVLRSTIHGLGQPLDAAAALRALHNSSNKTAVGDAATTAPTACSGNNDGENGGGDDDSRIGGDSNSTCGGDSDSGDISGGGGKQRQMRGRGGVVAVAVAGLAHGWCFLAPIPFLSNACNSCGGTPTHGPTALGQLHM